jgi:hypothetical protein
MGIQKNITLDSGVNLPAGYIKINTINIINGVSAIISVDIYKDKAASDDNKPSVVRFNHICSAEYHQYFGINVLNQSNVNTISQSYNYLKTLSFYAGAVDVFDVKE